MNHHTLLVPLDGSELAEAALTKAEELAAIMEGPRLLLLRAAEAHTFPGVDPTEAQVKVVREAEQYLAAVADRLERKGIRNVQVSVWYGPPATSIVEAARFYKVDLIVMSTHGRSGLGRLILGSVAQSVIHGTTTPILLVRRPEAPVQAPEGADQAREEKRPGNA
jgi:nucleotide-binding universal stress UspA family protein